jgi:hypothetical protein
MKFTSMLAKAIAGLLPLLLLAVAEGDEPFRAARSVHLSYPAPEAVAFYNEMVVERSVDGSYFMACGWNTGYFGVQQLGSETNKVVIFSVWDNGKGGDDPKTTRTEDRVEVLYEGQGVRIKRFGGEGTGGQCMAPFSWKVGETNRFLIRGEVQGEKTAYTASIFDPAKREWWKLATFRTPTGGKPLKGLYSFIEDFRRDFKSANETRRARFGNGWIKTVGGEKTLLRLAKFTASGATWEAKENIDAGVNGPWFYLATGGELKRSRELGSQIERRASESVAPAVLDF